MSSKINVSKIIKGHLLTLKDASTGKISAWDLFLFILFPFLVAGVSSYHKFELPPTVVANLLTIGVLLSALLLNLLVIVYTLKDRLPNVDNSKDGWESLQLKHSMMNELYYNISASVITSFFILIFSLVHNLVLLITVPIKVTQTFEITSLNGLLVDPVLAFLTVNLILSFLMIIKRTYLLLVTND